MADERPLRSEWLQRSIPIWVVAIVVALPLFGDGVLRSDEREVPDASRRVARSIRPEGRRGERPGRVRRAEPVARERTDLSAYRGLGSWIDIYNEWPWDHPQAAVNTLYRKGVKTIFLQTSNYGADKAIFRKEQTAKFLHAAHRKNMKVVAWYVPSFAHPKVDRFRSLAPIRFKTERGHRFDSFGMDIEATVVDRIWVRNKRFLDLSKWLRWKVGPDYPLGAITPDPVTGLYWPRFPYKRTRRLYDVFVPMGYFSFRASGYRDVKNYTATGIKTIRRETEDPEVPIHWIGGIAGETKGYEVKAFVRAIKGHNAIGGSYYDFTITTPEEWSELRVIAGRPPPDRDPKPEPKRERKEKPKPAKGKDKRSGKDDKKRDRPRDKRDRRDARGDGKRRDRNDDKLRKHDEEETSKGDTIEDDPAARRLLWSAGL